MKILRLKGGFEEVGREVGQATSTEITGLHDRVAAYLLEYTTAGSAKRMREIAARYALTAQDQFPPAIEFLRGLAEGSGSPFHEIALIAFSEEISSEFLPAPEKCSTLVVRTQRGWLVGHNEDYEPHYLGRMIALDVEFDGFPRLACLAYPGQLLGGGSLNAAGVALVNNSLWPAARPGLSKAVQQFQASLAGDLDEAVGILAGQPNALTTHYTVVDGTLDDAVSIEVSNHATSEADVVFRQISGQSFCHTNHVLYLPLRALDPAAEHSSHSFKRYAKLKALAPEALPQGPDEMMAYLSTNDGILHRTPAQNQTSATLATVVIRPETGEFWARDADPDAAEKEFYVALKPSSLH